MHNEVWGIAGIIPTAYIATRTPQAARLNFCLSDTWLVDGTPQ